MKTFRDKTGREWAIVVDLPAITRVMHAGIEYMGEPLKVNLIALVEPDSELLQKAAEYPPLVGGIVYALCLPQCVERNVSDVEFAGALDGEVLQNALECVLEETIDFFPRVRKTVLKKLLAKTKVFAAKAEALAETRLETGEIDQAIDRLLDEEMQKLTAPLTTGTGTAGSLSESPASIPPDERLPN